MTDPIDTAKLRELIDEADLPGLVPGERNIRLAQWMTQHGTALLDRLDAQAEELAALRRNRAAWEASGQDAEKRSRYAEARALLLEAEITRLGKEIERRDQSLASRRKIVREAFGLVRPLKAMVSELEAKRRELEVFSSDLIADVGRSGHKLDKAAERIQYLETWLRGLMDGRNAMPVSRGTTRRDHGDHFPGIGKMVQEPLPASRGTTSGQLLQLHDRAERPDTYAVADSEGGEV